MRSKAYKAGMYIARILLWAILLGAGALTIFIMAYFWRFGMIAIVGAILIDLVIRFDARLNQKRNGGTGHDSGGNGTDE